MSNSSIIKIIIYSILIILLLSFMSYVLSHGDFWFSLHTYEKTELHNQEFNLENINNLDINIVSTDITIKNNEDNNIKVIINGKEDRKDKYIISDEKGTLTIKEQSFSNFCFGFCFYDEEIIIYLPTTYNESVKIKSTSGDVTILDSYNSNMNIETVSGDVKLQDTNNLKVKTTSGDISAQKTNTLEAQSTSGDININSSKEAKISSTSGELFLGDFGNIELNTVSGDIRIDTLNITTDSKIKTTSGDVKINKINDTYIETNTTSGDIRISNNNRHAKNTLTIKTTSGDVTVNN